MRTQSLASLYEQIHACIKCSIGEDEKRVMRAIDQRVTQSKVFLIGQALAETTQRVSGIPYTKKEGELSRTGEILNQFLGLFGYTVNHKDTSRLYAYSSDTVQCYTGKNKSGKSDRKPTTIEIANCLGFLQRELQLVEPKLVLLMGKPSRDSFFKCILKQPQSKPLSEHIAEITRSGNVPQFNIVNKNIHALPIQHPSTRNPRFKEMTHNNELIELIKEILR